MKQILSIAALFGITILLTSAITFRNDPQDHLPQKKEKKHINIVKVENGEEIKIDTVIETGQVFVWNGDTIDAPGKLKWISEDSEFNFDSTMNINLDFEGMGDKHVFVVRSDDANKAKVMSWSSEDGNEMIFAPGGQKHMMVLPELQKGNVIDLSDPGIISFEKKELKDGTEKITIVREKPSPEKKEIRKEIVVTGAGAPMMLHEDGLPMKKRIKVIAGDDGNVQVLENGKLLDIENMEEGEKVIEKDGKKIIIKKIKEGDGMKVNVEVEENEEQK